MADENYWKDAYKDVWKTSGSRENKIKSLLEKAGFTVEVTGFGAGTEEFLPGRPQNYGHQMGDPDLYVVDVDVWVEVTGTDYSRVQPTADLWVRPDKIRNYLTHPDHDTVIVHVLDHIPLIRFIHLSAPIAHNLLAPERLVHPPILLIKIRPEMNLLIHVKRLRINCTANDFSSLLNTPTTFQMVRQ